MKNLVLYFDISKDTVIEDIMDFLLDNHVEVLETRVILAGVQSIFVVCMCESEYTKVFVLFFNDAYLTNKLIPKSASIEEFGIIN